MNQYSYYVYYFFSHATLIIIEHSVILAWLVLNVYFFQWKILADGMPFIYDPTLPKSLRLRIVAQIFKNRLHYFHFIHINDAAN